MSGNRGRRILLLDDAAIAERKGLVVVRSLARDGYTVSLGSHSFTGGVFHSRYVESRHRLPDEEPGSPAYVEALSELVEREAFDTVLAASDSATLRLAHAADALPGHLNCPVPPVAAATLAKNKPATIELANEMGIATPRTWMPETAQEVDALADQLPYPCVVKPRQGAGSYGQATVHDPKELRAAWGRRPAPDDAVFDFRRPLVQQHVEGRVHEVCCLFHHGEPRALLTQTRLMMQPAEGGPGIYNETTDEPDLKEIASGLLGRLNWHGPAQVEFLRRKSDGSPLLLEINGRFWGTLGLSVAAGMDFPRLTVQMALRGDVKPQHDYRVGVRHRWIIPHAFRYAVESGHWGTAIRRFLFPARGVYSELDWRDPLPQVMEFHYALRRMIRGSKKIP